MGSLTFLLGIGLLARLGMLFWYLSTHGWTPETWEYEKIALNLLEKHEFSYPYLGNDYRSYVGTVFPFFCYLLHVIGGQSLALYVVVHLSLGLTTVWLTYRLASKWLGAQTGSIAGLMVALEPGLVVYNSYKVDVLTLAICLLLIGLAVFDRVTSTGQYRWSALLGGLVGVAILTRLDLIALLAPYVLWLIRGGHPRRAILVHGLLATGLAIVLMTPWIARNYAVHGRLLLTTTSGEQLWIGNHEGATGAPDPSGSASLRAAPSSIRDAVVRGTELEQYDAFRTEAVRTILGDPAGFFHRALRKFAYFWWFTPAYGEFYQKIPKGLRDTYRFGYAILLILAVMGAVTVRAIDDKRTRLLLWSALAIMFVIAFIHAAYFVEGRHRVLVMPLLLMFSAQGASILAVRAIRSRRLPGTLP